MLGYHGPTQSLHQLSGDVSPYHPPGDGRTCELVSRFPEFVNDRAPFVLPKSPSALVVRSDQKIKTPKDPGEDQNGWTFIHQCGIIRF